MLSPLKTFYSMNGKRINYLWIKIMFIISELIQTGTTATFLFQMFGIELTSSCLKNRKTCRREDTNIVI